MKNKKNQASLSTRRADMILNEYTPFVVSEAYKSARTNLIFKLTEKGRNSVVFTSSYASEGKTTTCINVAITFAQTGYKVLVVDADLRKPSIHRLLNVPLVPGLTDSLAGLTGEGCIKPTAYENLFCLSAGTIPFNPSELLASEKMTATINAACEEFDYVFIDTPPVGLVTDAAILATKTVGALIVARQGYSTKDGIKYAIKAINGSGAEVLGFMFVDAELDMTTHGHYGYGKRYGYSYGYGQSSVALRKRSAAGNAKSAEVNGAEEISNAD